MELYIIMYLNTLIIIDTFKLISLRWVWGVEPSHVLNISQFRCTYTQKNIYDYTTDHKE